MIPGVLWMRDEKESQFLKMYVGRRLVNQARLQVRTRLVTSGAVYTHNTLYENLREVVETLRKIYSYNKLWMCTDRNN